jgi:putative oxidoreductase
MTTSTVTVAPARRALHRTVWALQVLVGVFFVVASAAPKFFGDPYAVEIFEGIGAGQWLRYAIGAVELAGGIGLLVPRLSAAAAVGLMGLMIGAGYTQAVILDAPAMATTPAILFALCAVFAYARRDRLADIVPARARG